VETQVEGQSNWCYTLISTRVCYYFVSIVIAIFATQPLQSTSAQEPVRVQQEIIKLDPTHTTIDFILAGKLHTTNGHFALRRGTIRIDPTDGDAGGEIVIDAASEDSNEALRDAITKNAVLEVGQYPEITFSPERIQGVRGAQNDFYGEISGQMRLHGAIHELTVPVQGSLSGDHLTAECEFLIPYAEWGLDSPNVLSSEQIVRSTKNESSGVTAHVFPVFAYLIPVLRRIPPNLLWVSDLVDVKMKAQAHIIWAPKPEAHTLTVIVPPAAQIKKRQEHSAVPEKGEPC